MIDNVTAWAILIGVGCFITAIAIDVISDFIEMNFKDKSFWRMMLNKEEK